MTIQQYDEYKDSGIAWLGQIPQHWEVCRLKHKYYFKTGATPASGQSKFYDGDIKWATISDLNGGIVHDTANHISEEAVEICSMSLCPKGSLMYSFKLSVGQVAFCGDEMYTNEAIASFEPQKGDLRYLYYIAPIFIKHNANINIYGALLLNQNLIKNAIICFPPLTEQEAIVRYLDERCDEVDGRIELEKKRIELLTELKQSIITQAVTEGLDPNAPKRNSGVQWLGQIPQHWEITKLKEFVEFINGYAFNSDMFVYKGDMPVIRIGDIVNGRLSYNDVVMVDISPNLNRFKIFPNDILLAMSGATVGKLGLVNEVDRGYINQRVGIIRSKLYKYVYYSLNTPIFMKYVQLTSEGSAQPNISTFSIRNYELPLPPLTEQEAIVRYLDEQCAEVDKRIERAKRKIELLTELKQSIITEAVTGKIKVC